MIRNIRYITSILALVGMLSITVSASAQKSYLEKIDFEQTQGVRKGQQVTILSKVRLDNVRLGHQDLIILVPKVQSNSGTNEQQLPPIFIAGSTRAKVIERESILNNEREYMLPEPVSITTRHNGKSQSVQYTTQIPYSSWMDEATLFFEEWVIGCAECDKGRSSRLITNQILVPPYKPDYKLVYIVPAVEPVKRRADKYVATVEFHVDKDQLDPTYRNNQQVLSEIGEKVANVLNNEDLTVTDLEIIGYASPEASVAYNKSLSERRAKAISDFLVNQHGVSRIKMIVSGYGEDWKMTREEVAASDLADKDKILQIIDSTPNPDDRDAKLKQLSNGATYQTLLKEIYPRMRRTEYALSYVVRGFDVAEAKQILKTNPKLLSLNEMYLVAQSYPAESKEFKEVFDIATRLYPNEPVAIINASAADIEGGNYQAAIDRLQKIGNNPDTWNNLAVAYALSGDYKTAEEYFGKANNAGNSHATHNIKELHKLLDQKKGDESISMND